MDIYNLPVWTNLESISACYGECHAEGSVALRRLLGRMYRVSRELYPHAPVTAMKLRSLASDWRDIIPDPPHACAVLDGLVHELQGQFSVPRPELAPLSADRVRA